MTTTIVPGIGQGAVFTQQGAGATPGYAAIDVRRSDSMGLQEGVYAASDFMVVQRGAGANMSVDIGMPAGGAAEVQGDAVNGQGLYYVPVHASTINEAIATADVTNPRVDQVILEIQDNVHDASGGNLARIRVLTGTPTSGANLTNRTGAVALPGSALLLADVLVGAAVSSITNAVIRDRRKWARGAYYRIIRTAGDYGIGTSYADIDATNISRRIECSGVPLELKICATLQRQTSAGSAFLAPVIDGVVDTTQEYEVRIDTIAARDSGTWTWPLLLAAGSHTLSVAAHANADTMIVRANAVQPVYVLVEEIVRQNTPNNFTTTG